MTIHIKGRLEIDQKRGVIYFHSDHTGHSPLRITNLPKPIPDASEYGVCLDINHMHACSWVEEYEKCTCQGFFRPANCPVHGRGVK